MFSLLKRTFRTKRSVLENVKAFGHANKDLLVIVADPKSDILSVSYGDKYVTGVIKSATGKRTRVVRDILKHSRFKVSIDDFITAVAETTHLSLPDGNQLYQYIDGAIYNIAKTLRAKKVERAVH